MDIPYMVSVLWADDEIQTTATYDRKGVIESFQSIVQSAEVADVICLALVADSFYQTMSDTDKLPASGELLNRFQEGDLTIREALVVTVVDLTRNESKAVQIPYGYGDDGMPKFDDPQAYSHSRIISVDGIFEGRLVVDGKAPAIDE